MMWRIQDLNPDLDDLEKALVIPPFWGYERDERVKERQESLEF